MYFRQSKLRFWQSLIIEGLLFRAIWGKWVGESGILPKWSLKRLIIAWCIGGGCGNMVTLSTTLIISSHPMQSFLSV